MVRVLAFLQLSSLQQVGAGPGGRREYQGRGFMGVCAGAGLYGGRDHACSGPDGATRGEEGVSAGLTFEGTGLGQDQDSCDQQAHVNGFHRTPFRGPWISSCCSRKLGSMSPRFPTLCRPSACPVGKLW